MAITLRPNDSDQHEPTHESHDVASFMNVLDADAMQTPAAQRALRAGVLSAKQGELRRAKWLAGLGLPLIIGMIFVSFFHMWETVAAIVPAYVPPLRVASWIHHSASAAYTVGIDFAALYVVSAGSVAARAGATVGRKAKIYFLAVTFLLNAYFVVKYAPTFPTTLRSAILPSLDIVFAVLLPLVIPVAIFAVEHARDAVTVAKLKLLVETTALETLNNDDSTGNGRTTPKKPATAKMVRVRTLDRTDSGVKGFDDDSDNHGDGQTIGDPGRMLEYDADAVLDMLPDEPIRRADIKKLAGNPSDTTLTRMIGQMTDSGRLQKVDRGLYQRQ